VDDRPEGSPEGLHDESALRVYTTEKGGPRVKVHDAHGALLAVVADTGFDPNCKNMDVAVDSRGRVHVVDTVRLEILVFEVEGEWRGRNGASSEVRAE
jgi:hypothetical protein